MIKVVVLKGWPKTYGAPHILSTGTHKNMQKNIDKYKIHIIKKLLEFLMSFLKGEQS